jgi:hypothetical protein
VISGPAALSRSQGNVHQRLSHAQLSPDVSQLPAPPLRSRRGRLDAVIVPAARPASVLQPAIELAARLGVLIVILCSMQTKVEQVAMRVAKTPGARSLIVRIPDNWKHPSFPKQTSANTFRKANAYRISDLSAKRNIGLLLARLHGWNKVAFVDDDITLSRTDNIARLAGQLDDHQVAGMRALEHPDNSVVCHARRLAGLAQDVFVTGAVLGVHCNSLPLSFFPEIYNEDWFFFANEAAKRSLPQIGHAKQADYDPFASPQRARWEEFGDLLAEGLYAMFGEYDPSVLFSEQLDGATRSYWSQFIEARAQVIDETMTLLRGFLDRDGHSVPVSSALESLSAAENQLATISADLCIDFLEAWREDLCKWQKFSTGVNSLGSTRAAMDFLELKTWTRAEFGAVIESEEESSIRPAVAAQTAQAEIPTPAGV